MNMPQEDKDKIAEERLAAAVPVVQSYGQSLGAANSAAEDEVLDAGDLPHPKALIKESLMTVLQSSQNPAEKQTLSAAYALLAKFQDAGSSVEQMDTERRALLEELRLAGFEL